jgi:hypothetical protein
MKRGKEIKLTVLENYNLTTGTVDNKNPKSVFITISAWCNPLIDTEIDYNKIINNLMRTIKGTLYNTLTNKFIKEQTIVDLDMRESGIKFDKRSYMCCEITLFQQNELLPITSEILLENINNITKQVLLDAFESNQYFTFHKVKK